MEEVTNPATESETQQPEDTQQAPEETEHAVSSTEGEGLDAGWNGADHAGDDDEAEPSIPVTFEVGETVKIAETFASYRGELATVTAVKPDPVGGGGMAADVELQKQRSVIDNSPVYFQNVPFSQLVKVD